MKNVIALLALTLILFFTATSAFAADPSAEKPWTAYAKAGWFSWNEKNRDGGSFVKEYGPINAIGIERRDRLIGPFFTRELVESWGGIMVYDGHDIFNTKKLKGATGYIGTREEVSLDAVVPLVGGFSLDPFAGLGHKFWFRVASVEVWNMAYARMGAKVTHVRPSGMTMYISGGEVLPLYTQNRLFTSAFTKYSDVNLKPKALPGLFGEAGVTFSPWDISLSYEEMRFGQSASVRSKSLDGYTSDLFHQPDSKTSTVWVKAGYSF